MKSPVEILKQSEHSDRQDMEWRKCRLSPHYFLKTYGKIKDPDKGIINFEDWPHLVNLLNLFLSEKDIIILKARQLGVSWLVAGYGLWKALFYEGSRVLMISQGEEEAWELLTKARFLHSQLPAFLKLELEKNQSGYITFPAAHSEIRALPSTEKAGHGYGASLVVRDELEHHPYAEENFAAISPSIDAGGQQIDLSTANKMKLNTHFKLRYMQAKRGENGAYPVFLSVKERTARLTDMSFDEWFAQIQRKYADWMVEQEYPLTEQDALDTLKTRRFFSDDALDIMEANQRKVLKHELSDKFKSVRIFEYPVVGKRYVMFTDPSDGKEDPHAIVVIDPADNHEVAESHGKTSADQCALIHDSLCRLYNDALNGWEATGGAGGIMTEKLKALDTPHKAAFIDVGSWQLNSTKGYGWWSSKKLWDKIIWNLEEAVRLNTIPWMPKECIDEFRQFIVPEGDEPQKSKGGHDDYIDAWARVLLLKRYMVVKKGEVKSYPYMREAW